MADDAIETVGRRERLRFVQFDFDRLANGGCHARVTLEWRPGAAFVGEADGLGSEAGRLRCAAQATLDAITEAVERRVGFELLGVKAVRAFDAVVTIVSVAVHDDAVPQRLVGSYLAEDNSPRGAAIAVLNATNRLLGNIFLRDVA